MSDSTGVAAEWFVAQQAFVRSQPNRWRSTAVFFAAGVALMPLLGVEPVLTSFGVTLGLVGIWASLSTRAVRRSFPTGTVEARISDSGLRCSVPAGVWWAAWHDIAAWGEKDGYLCVVLDQGVSVSVPLRIIPDAESFKRRLAAKVGLPQYRWRPPRDRSSTATDVL